MLWVVPSSQIYRDTLRRLRDRGDMYRLMLEHAVSRRIEVWEKHEIARLSPARLRECLNILVIQLASTNRETKEQLKFFRDSGGNIVQHFPPEDDPAAHKALKEQVGNLEMLAEDEATRAVPGGDLDRQPGADLPAAGDSGRGAQGHERPGPADHRGVQRLGGRRVVGHAQARGRTSSAA